MRCSIDKSHIERKQRNTASVALCHNAATAADNSADKLLHGGCGWSERRRVECRSDVVWAPPTNTEAPAGECQARQTTRSSAATRQATTQRYATRAAAALSTRYRSVHCSANDATHAAPVRRDAPATTALCDDVRLYRPLHHAYATCHSATRQSTPQCGHTTTPPLSHALASLHRLV